MSEQLVLCRVEEGVAVVTLNNPPLNVVTLELTRQLEQTLDGFAADPSARVLVLHGQFDETVAAVDHTQIAPWVNARTPGAATHRVLEGLDHCWTRHPSMDASRGRCGQGNAVPVLSDAILEFLRSWSG